MKFRVQITSSEQIAAVVVWLKEKEGINVTAEQIEEIELVPDAVVLPVVPEGSAPPIVSVVVAPTAPPSQAGHLVTVNPPFSVTGQATMFGLNYGGSDDKGDENKQGQPLTGFFIDPATGKNYVTHDKNLVGCSLPREVMLSTFLKIDSWRSEGIDSVWSKNGSMLRQWVDGNKPTLTIDSDGLSAEGVPLVDAGPAASTGHCLDLTYSVAHALKTVGEATVTFMILVAGKPLEIRGWDSTLGKVA